MIDKNRRILKALKGEKADWEKLRLRFYGFMSAGRDNEVETTDKEIFDWFKNKLDK